MDEQQNIIIYRTADGKASVALYAKDGKIWLNQQQMAELFATSKPNISMHIANILKERELYKDSVVKEFLTTAADGKNYNVVFYTKRRTRPHSACRERHTLEESPYCVKIKGAAAPSFLLSNQLITNI